MTAAASGRMPASGAPAACCLMARSAKKRWWLTMMMSDSSALRRISVMKQRSQSGQVWPRQASLRASSLCQSAEDSGRSSISARSPVSVVFSHCGDGVELVDLFEAGEERLVAQGVELVAAEIVGAALHVADLQRAEQRFEEGDVLEEELLLQILGAGGDDDALLALAGEAQRGQQIGEGLAGAGAGFDDEVALVREGAFDGSRHLVLAGRCSKASEERERMPPGEKNSCRVGRFSGRGGRDRDGSCRGQCRVREICGTESRCFL